MALIKLKKPRFFRKIKDKDVGLNELTNNNAPAENQSPKRETRRLGLEDEMSQVYKEMQKRDVFEYVCDNLEVSIIGGKVVSCSCKDMVLGVEDMFDDDSVLSQDSNISVVTSDPLLFESTECALDKEPVKHDMFEI
jgi:hypothetical protein